MGEGANRREEILQRALYYESQYRNAMVSDAVSFYDLNLTKDLIETDFFYKSSEGDIRSTLDLVGLSAPCKFSDFIDTWANKMVGPDNIEKYPFFQNLRQTMIDLYNQGKRDYVVEYWMTSTHGKKVYVNQSFLLTTNEYGEICALSIVKDHTKTRVLEDDAHKKELEQYAYYDPVTHGYNYIKFKDRLNEVSIAGSIISLDIHSFKIINSICGILRGDQVIEAIWNLIKDIFEFENGDIAGHINADHFIIFVPSFNQEVIIRKIKNMTLALNIISAELSVPQLMPYYGVAKWTPGKKIELSYSESVAAKHNAKELQNLNYAFFDEADTVRLIKEKTIADSFENALARKEFKVWYQPKYNPVNGQLVGAEALVRWQTEEGAIIPPGDFISIFEKNGMIRRFDEYIFRNVCKQIKTWEFSHKKIVPISINLSRISLYYKNIVTDYKRISEEIGIDKSLLPIEITETAAVTNNEIKDIADAFYAAGFKLHMDDFGSGYSSLASLNVMHFDTLKIDKSLIDYIGNFGGDRLLEHTILLAKELGMHVTAEGVENDKQVAFLKHVGCDSIQGFFYSKPLPCAEFEKLLENLSLTENKIPYDFLDNHITSYKSSIIKPPIYSFVINLTKNTFFEPSGSSDWREETNIPYETFDEAVREMMNFILPEYKQAYYNFINRKHLIESYLGHPETRIIEYKRMFHGKETDMRLMAHIFKDESTGELWMYETVALQ